MKTKKATEIKIGDTINVNTGYRPLDDENCKILDRRETTGLFNNPQIEFYIESSYGNHWYVVSPENILVCV